MATICSAHLITNEKNKVKLSIESTFHITRNANSKWTDLKVSTIQTNTCVM